MEYAIKTPLREEVIQTLKIGDVVKITGTIYTARDAAHARLVKLIEEGKELPFSLEGQIIYYVGPTPAKPGCVYGSLCSYFNAARIERNDRKRRTFSRSKK